MKLKIEECFKIFMILDNLDFDKKYNKNFLLLCEFFKENFENMKDIYISMEDNLIGEQFYELEELRYKLSNIDSELSEEEQKEIITQLNEEYKEVIEEYNLMMNQFIAVSNTSIDFVFDKKIPKDMIKNIFSEEQIEILKPIIEG
jgi:hypothetical protein